MNTIYQVSTPTGQDTTKRLPPGQKASPASSPRCPPETFLNEIEARRYEFLAEQFREIDRPVLAQMCRNWAKEHRGLIARRTDIERRRAAGDPDVYAGLSINGGSAE